MKRLYRDRSDMMIAGVCSGLAKYIGLDPTAVRLAFIILLFMGLGGLWLYIIFWIIMPLEPSQSANSIEVNEKPKSENTSNLLSEPDSKPK